MSPRRPPWSTAPHRGRRFRYIVFPQLVPIIGLLAVLRTIWTFNEFDDIFLLTGGAAGTGVASVQIYNFLTVQRNVGAAAAQSVIMSLVLIVAAGDLHARSCAGEERRHDHRVAAPPRRRARSAGRRAKRPGPATASQRRVFGVLRWVVIALFLLATLVPFYYMILLSREADRGAAARPGRRCSSAPRSSRCRPTSSAVLHGQRRPGLRPASSPTARSSPCPR